MSSMSALATGTGGFAFPLKLVFQGGGTGGGGISD
jgi:uncharacterized membrane protein